MEKQKIHDLIAHNLRDLMNEKSMQVSELAKRCNVSHGMISKILHGTTGATIATALELAAGLDVNLERLLAGLDQKRKSHKKRSKKPTEVISIGILSIDNKRLTCIKDSTGNIIGESQLEKGLDLVESSSNLLRLIQESIAAALHENKKYLDHIKNAKINLVTQSYEFEETKEKFSLFMQRYFKQISMLSDWQLTYFSAFGRKPGIALTTDKGVSLSYRANEQIKKIGGWKFPVYDLGGENWLGYETVKHTIEAAEGLIPMSKLAHTVLSKFSGRIDKLTETCLRSNDADFLCLFADPLIRLYLAKDPSAEALINIGYQHIEKLIHRVDDITGEQRKIVLNGSLTDIYKPFIDQSRLVKPKSDQDKARLLADIEEEFT